MQGLFLWANSLEVAVMQRGGRAWATQHRNRNELQVVKDSEHPTNDARRQLATKVLTL